MRKSEEDWGVFIGGGSGIDGYMDAGKDDDEGGGTVKPPPTKP
tara:strand:+ start:1265 stop:1393 length:129 start_codon:yes stop_codon:yes gene_type:complete